MMTMPRLAHHALAGLAMAATLALPAPAVRAQETIRMQVATGHPPIFLWVKHLRESFMPTVDAELAKTGKYRMAWNESYGGTLAKLGSELETMQQGISDLGTVSSVFQTAKMPLNNVTFFVPFGPTDTSVVIKSFDYVQELPELTGEWKKFGIVHLASFALDSYQTMTTFPINRVEDLKGRKISAAGPNLNWIKNTGAVGVQGNLNVWYNDIKTGVYDGGIVFITAAVPGKFFEVAPHFTKFDFGAMAPGSIAVNAGRWNKLPDEVKAAFRRGANAYKANYLREQQERIATSYEAWQKAGGKVTEFPEAERLRLIKMLPNPSKDWLKQAGPNGRKVLVSYMDTVRATGFRFVRDWDKE